MTRLLGLLLLTWLLVGPTIAGAADAPKSAPVPVAESAGRIKLPDGFKATLFAGEPDVVQPIAFCFDGRGRLWVAESYTYPGWKKPGEEGDDIIRIFEDTDGDGRFDKKTVFWDQVPNVSGIEVGFGGVYVCSTPNLLFVPDADGDDKPDGPAKVLLDGWNVDKAGHNVFNGLSWGPDGWLWGLNGIQSKSAVGKPGTPPDRRVKFDCGVWKYHPTRGDFEVVAYGTTNPWGLDFDDYGQPFITNCVIAHLWHVVPGAHYQRMYGEDPVANVYKPIDSCADHLHFTGNWTDAKKGPLSQGNTDAGGGHAHVGAMLYLGDNWPDAYRNGLFTCNLHGNRVNHDLLEPKGSGYVARHGKDFLFANDGWFRGLELAYGPDGGVFVTDWSDTGECHDVDKVELGNGRIFKVTYGDAKPVKVDAGGQSDDGLVQWHLRKNDWFVRHARLELQQRRAAGKLAATVTPALEKMLAENPDVTRRLRALWTLHAIGALTPERAIALLDDKEPYVKAWAMHLELEDKEASDAFLARVTTLASDASPVVRLHVASVAQRIAPAKRWAIVEALASNAENANDPMLPLMTWYAAAPLVSAEKVKGVQLLAKTKVPLIREYVTRRIAGK
jgi:putative membrane-bound dehydrogenase-like protein